MDKNKISILVFGFCLLLGGCAIVYFYNYKHDEITDGTAYILMFCGWGFIFMQAAEGTIIDAPQISWNKDGARFLKIKIVTFFYYLITLGAVVTLGVWLTILGAERKSDILQNAASGTTIAVVDHIDEHMTRNTVNYYAVFQYTVNGKLVSHRWQENISGEFSAGQRFEIKYSAEHPDMFVIVKQLK
jgi:uncharacterized membrane protein